MFVAENTVEIDRPVEEVFVFVTNPYNIPRWRKNAIEALQVQEPIQAGSTYVLAENYMGRKEFGQRVTEFVPNQRFVVETTSGSIRPVQRFSFEPTASGGTRYHARLEVHTRGFMRLMEPMLRGQVRKSMVEFGNNLKRLLEAQPRTAAP